MDKEDDIRGEHKILSFNEEKRKKFMSLFLDTVKKDFIDKKMKIVESSYVRKSRLNNKKITVTIYYMVWENGDKHQISKYSLESFMEEVKSDILNKQL